MALDHGESTYLENCFIISIVSKVSYGIRSAAVSEMYIIREFVCLIDRFTDSLYDCLTDSLFDCLIH